MSHFFFTGVFTAAFDCQIEWLIVKGIADYADGSQLASESWSSCASAMAASLVTHILNEPCVFHSWPHYQGNNTKIILPVVYYYYCFIFAVFEPRLGLHCIYYYSML